MNANHDIQQIQTQLIEDFAFLKDWESRYQYLIEKGRELLDYSPQHRTEEYRVKGCQSQVWLKVEPMMNKANPQDPILHLQATSDAAIVRGLLAIILDMFNDQSAQSILNAPLDFITIIGLADHLTPQRKNGLAAMLKTLHEHARLALQTHSS